ncbi:MAG: nucleoside deaminase [Acidimicrobiia bacterium]
MADDRVIDTEITATDDAVMTRAFALAWEARRKGDHPFSGVLAVDGEVVAEGLNAVFTGPDLTAHGETVLVRNIERDDQLELLARGTVYASTEPCPMCMGALYWAGARRVVFGLSSKRLYEIINAGAAPPVGFSITAAEIGASARPAITVLGPYREDEAVEAHLDFWGGL